MINSTAATHTATSEIVIMKNIFNDIFAMIRNSVSEFSNIEDFVNLVYTEDVKLPVGGAFKFYFGNEKKCIVVNIGAATVMVFEEKDLLSFRLSKNIEGNFTNEDMTLEDILLLKHSVNLSTECVCNSAASAVIAILKHRNKFKNVETFTMEEMNSIIKNTTEEITQPQPTVEQVVETTPEPAPTPEQATVEEPSEPPIKEETKAAEPPKATPKETPFYKKKSFWVGAGCAVGVGAAVAWRIRSKLHSS